MKTKPTPGVRRQFRALALALGSGIALASASQALSGPAPNIDYEITGDWTVRISVAGAGAASAGEFTVAPPEVRTIQGEKIASLPVFRPAASGWTKGARLSAVMADECTATGLLLKDSLQLRDSKQPDGALFEPGVDFDADGFWGTLGRLPEGKIQENQPVFASYRHTLPRIDSIVSGSGGKLALVSGLPHPVTPRPPALTDPTQKRLMNIWLAPGIAKLTQEHLFPILEEKFPALPPADTSAASAADFLPDTMKKLRSGGPVLILAWGDSVTDAGYLSNPAVERWQEQFAAALRQRFPKAKIDLRTEAWGGRNTSSYLGEHPGSAHHFGEKVLGPKPDLIISEFVNDVGLAAEQAAENYQKIQTAFRGAGAEWIILTPHYVRMDWMALKSERNIDQDPRAHVAFLREFAGQNKIALADASARWGRLWRQGIPYTTLLRNAINHPNAEGMKIFADTLLEIFPKN